MEALALDYISIGELTYWPSDPAKIPDLIDFGITKGIPKNSLNLNPCLNCHLTTHQFLLL